ncbi:hypothetical protein [Balneicella halophila]|nr:hypothetical protein [Balneicella halophila]
MIIYFKRFALFFLILIAFSCANNKAKHPVQVADAFVQSWSTVEAKSRGTHLEVTLTGNVSDVKILAVVYNNLQVTPIVEIKKEELIVRADFETGTQKIFEKPAVTTKRDMIIYNHRGKIYELPLENIIRKEAKYYPVK